MVKRVNDDMTAEGAEQTDSRMSRRDRDEGFEDRNAGYNTREFSNRDWDNANGPTDPARRRAYREKWAQTHLPNLPVRDGWHRCWVSINHPTDTPARRLALGYRIITLEQLKTEGTSWAPEAASVKDAGSIEGAVRWREMVGMECTEDDYQEYMREFHHDQPRDMARDIYEPLMALQERAGDAGGRITVGDGFKEMQKFRRSPKQFE
jgi:hypothetical protein